MNPNLPVGGSAIDLQLGARSARLAGVTQLSFTVQSSFFSRHFAGSTSVAGDDSLQSVFTLLSLRHHLGKGWALDATLPAGLIRLDRGANAPVEYITGIGDIEIGGRYELAELWGPGGYRPSLTLRLGLGLPTGEQRTVGEMGGAFPPSILSIGRATYSVNARAELTQFVHRSIGLLASVGPVFPLSPTAGGITFAPSLDYGVGALWLPRASVSLLARVTGRYQGHAREQGEGVLLNSGGHWLFAELGAAWRIDARWSLGIGARTPFFVDLNGRQPVETISVLTTVGLVFGVDEPHKHEGHEEHEQHDGEHEQLREQPVSQAASTGDVRELARGGETFDATSAPVAGRVTVIDFWASWCQPCKAIDAELRRLAARHPIAVRRVEVPELDSAVGKEHLANVEGLPVLWIHDRAGNRVATLVGSAATPAKVGKTIRRLLALPPSP